MTLAFHFDRHAYRILLTLFKSKILRCVPCVPYDPESRLNINTSIPSRIYHLAHSSDTYKKRRRGQSIVRQLTVLNKHASCNNVVDLSMVDYHVCSSDVYCVCNSGANGSWQGCGVSLRCRLHLCAQCGCVQTCPYGSDSDGGAEGAHRETSTGWGTAAPLAITSRTVTLTDRHTSAAALHKTRPEGEPSQTHEYRTRQVSEEGFTIFNGYQFTKLPKYCLN